LIKRVYFGDRLPWIINSATKIVDGK
jgi:hypothetical protein